MKKDFRVIGFDADDTLWVNEPYYKETEELFCHLMSDFGTAEEVSRELLKTEMQNLELYGYGAKAFMLSMIETAYKISDREIGNGIFERIIQLGRDLINKPVVLLDGIGEVLEKLKAADYTMILATKGDLLDQERKLMKSGLEDYFHHIEIMSEKKEENYVKLISHLDIDAEDFLMIGNSMRSDIIPVLNIGGYAIYVPYHTTWVHERVEETPDSDQFHEITAISDFPEILGL
jgi:putative hydrolase of the HAD superfamily